MFRDEGALQASTGSAPGQPHKPTHVRKCGWCLTVSSSFSRKVRSVASPGRRHSSSWGVRQRVKGVSGRDCRAQGLRGPHGRRRHRGKGRVTGSLPDLASTSPHPPQTALSCLCSNSGSLRTGPETKGKGVMSSHPAPNTGPWRSRRLTKMEMMPLNFSSTRSQMILLLKYWTGSH